MPDYPAKGQPKIITAPAVEPVSLAETKLHLHHTPTEEDEQIKDWIREGREYLEKIANRAYVSQTLEQYHDGFPGDKIVLRRLPVQSITSIKYTDADGAEQTLAASRYTLDVEARPAEIVRAFEQTWPETRAVPNAVVVRYIAGFASMDDIPRAASSYIKLFVAKRFANRGDQFDPAQDRDLEEALNRILWGERVMEIA